MHLIFATARNNEIYVSICYSEVEVVTLDLAEVLIGPEREILNH